MKVIDLCHQYISCVLKTGDRTAYEKQHPELFDHYYEFYGDRNKPLVSISPEDLNHNLRIVKEELGRLKDPFKSRGFDIDNVEIILFVGQGTTNGHAMRSGSDFKVWLPVEAYNTQLLSRVFIAHEIIHSLHYTRSSEFYYESREDMYRTGRLLITEGLATYITMEILGIGEGEALWADYLDKDHLTIWLDLCRKNQVKIKEILRRNFDGDHEGAILFQANNPNNILEYRCGYYFGMKIIEQISSKMNLSVEDLLEIPRNRFMKLAFDLL